MQAISHAGRVPNVLDRLRPSSAVVVVLILYLSTHGHIPFLMSVDKTVNDAEGIIGLTAQAVFLLILGLLCVPYPKRLMRAARLAGPLLAISLLAVLSSLWSQDPSITLRRSVMLLAPTLFALLLHVGYGYREQLELLLVAGIAAAVFSIALALRFPAVGLDPTMTDGSWQGIFPQKNVCARACVFFMLPALTLLWRSAGSTLLALVALPLLAGVVFMSNSITGLILGGTVVVSTLCMRMFRRLPSNEAMVVGMLIAVAGLASLFFLQSSVTELLPLLGKDSTLTGRTEIWDGAIEAITKHPVLGFGFSAFWLGLKGESANVILAARWLVPSAHDGFLDVWLQLGGVGLALFLYSLYKACRAAVWCLRHVGWEAAEWAAGIVLLTLLYNLDETSLMIPRELLWTLYCLAFVNLRAMMLHERALLRTAHAVAAVCVAAEMQKPEMPLPQLESALPQLEPAMTR